MICEKTIWNERQNKPRYIVEDIRAVYPEVPADFIYSVLLRRGVFKWLAVRRHLIRLKNEMRDEIRDLNYTKKTLRENGRHNALVEVRKRIRQLCHSQRWVAPDNDSAAIDFLMRMSE